MILSWVRIEIIGKFGVIFIRIISKCFKLWSNSANLEWKTFVNFAIFFICYFRPCYISHPASISTDKCTLCGNALQFAVYIVHSKCLCSTQINLQVFRAYTRAWSRFKMKINCKWIILCFHIRNKNFLSSHTFLLSILTYTLSWSWLLWCIVLSHKLYPSISLYDK